jgi:hypothetical protein
MNFTLLPDLPAFLVGFVLVGAVAVALLLGALGTFFVENRVVRVRRHESLVHYYGHLALGH